MRLQILICRSLNLSLRGALRRGNPVGLSRAFKAFPSGEGGPQRGVYAERVRWMRRSPYRQTCSMMISSSVSSKPLYTMGFANPPSPLGKDLVSTVSSVYSRGDWLSRSLRVVEAPTPTGVNFNLNSPINPKLSV